jgi:hypothetical protein
MRQTRYSNACLAPASWRHPRPAGTPATHRHSPNAPTAGWLRARLLADLPLPAASLTTRAASLHMSCLLGVPGSSSQILLGRPLTRKSGSWPPPERLPFAVTSRGDKITASQAQPIPGQPGPARARHSRSRAGRGMDRQGREGPTKQGMVGCGGDRQRGKRATEQSTREQSQPGQHSPPTRQPTHQTVICATR